MIRITSGASRFNIYKFSEVLVLRNVEKVLSKRDDFIVDALFCLEPVQKFEYRSDVFSFRCSCYYASFAVTGKEICFRGKFR